MGGGVTLRMFSLLLIVEDGIKLNNVLNEINSFFFFQIKSGRSPLNVQIAYLRNEVEKTLMTEVANCITQFFKTIRFRRFLKIHKFKCIP